MSDGDLDEAAVKKAIDFFHDTLLDAVDEQFDVDGWEPPFYLMKSDFDGERFVVYVTKAAHDRRENPLDE